MFSPVTQGTIRPWSERGFFMLFELLLGLNSLPWGVVRLHHRCRRHFSDLPACSAPHPIPSRRILSPVLWIANPALTDTLCRTSVYNELLCPLFLLSALLLFMR
jgi:hypothetical protein